MPPTFQNGCSSTGFNTIESYNINTSDLHIIRLSIPYSQVLWARFIEMGPVALILFLILDSVSCTCVWTRSFTPVCHSVRDAQTGYYWWEDLRIVNPNYTANETLSYAYFGKAPNLRRLLIRGAINDIMPGAFDGLTKLDSLILEHNNLQVFYLFFLILNQNSVVQLWHIFRDLCFIFLFVNLYLFTRLYNRL